MPSIDQIRDAVVAHYAAHARVLPWRAPPGNQGPRPDPYHVWLSEIMLQQTTVAAVIPYFNRFTQRWPDLAAFAAADNDAVMAAWAGLGYYSRARNLVVCAQAVMSQHDGRFPEDVASLSRLPGIGPYTAAAINAFAFGGDAIPLDANVERIVARLFAVTTPLPRAKAEIAAAARALWPDRGGGDFAQTLMDLGAGPCSARHPRCGECPLQPWCSASTLGVAEQVPAKAKKKPRPERFGRAWWIERGVGRDAQVQLVRRPPHGLLGGMLALPGPPWTDAPPVAPDTSQGPSVRHIFTHFTLHLTVERMTPDRALSQEMPGDVTEGQWWPISRLDEAGLPALYRRAAGLMLKERS